jgi:hypothetical protein
VGIPLPANFSKLNGAQVDDNDAVSSGDSEIPQVESSKLLASEGVVDTAALTGIICYLFGYFVIGQHCL